MKFDWYQASIPEVSPHLVMDTLSAANYYGDWEQSRPLKNYAEAAQFVIGGEVLYKINYGGQNEEYGSNVVATGSAASSLAEIIRTHFPTHRVSRVDSCVDYHHADVYDYLRKKALKIAKDQKVYVKEITKPLDDCDDGRSLYLGADSSAVRLRLYEKGKQLGVSDDWVRAELQLRPQKDTKSIAAVLTPEQVWGLAKWSHALAIQMGHEKLQRVDAQIYQPSDYDRAYRFMISQYRKVLEHMKASHGSWETVGAQIGYDLEHSDDLPAKVSLKPVKPV